MTSIPDGQISVSVVIPVYNAEAYLKQCLDSVANQTLRNIEIICVDDGSTDGSLDILKEYKKQDDRFIILTQTHKNAGAARNQGLDIAQGKYLSFLDADDFFELDMLEDCFHKIETETADIICFSAKQYDTRTNEYSEMPWSLNTENLPKKESFSPDEIENLFGTFQNWAWNKLFRNEFIKTNRIRFQEIQRTNDMLFTCSSLVLARRITTIDHTYATYRVGTGVSMQQTNSEHPAAFWAAYTATKDFLLSENQYACYERSFLNWVLDGIIYNLYSLKNEPSRLALLYHLKYCGEQDFHFLDHESAFYYSQSCFNEYKQIVEQEIIPIEQITRLNNEIARQESKIARQENEIIRQREETAQLTASLAAVRASETRYKKELAHTSNKLNALRSSISFKIGCLITWLPRKIRLLIAKMN